MEHIYTPRVLRYIHFRHNDTFGSRIRTVMDYEFDFCVGCDREMWLDGTWYKITKGCFVIRKPGQKVYAKGAYDCHMLTLDFSNRSAYTNYSRNTATQIQAPFDSKIWDVLPVVFQPPHFDEYQRIFESFAAINEIDLNENPKTLLLVNELLHLVVSHAYRQLYPPESKMQTPMDTVCFYIKKHFAEEIRLDDIAAVVHLNKSYLVRQFKKIYGLSPISYLMTIRMDYAKKLLAESDLPIKTIAAYCGYKDPSFFNAYFKKTFSVTPLFYRHLQQIAER